MRKLPILPKPPPTRYYKDMFGVLVFDEKQYKKDLRRTVLVNKVIWLINADRG